MKVGQSSFKGCSAMQGGKGMYTAPATVKRKGLGVEVGQTIVQFKVSC